MSGKLSVEKRSVLRSYDTTQFLGEFEGNFRNSVVTDLELITHYSCNASVLGLNLIPPKYKNIKFDKTDISVSTSIYDNVTAKKIRSQAKYECIPMLSSGIDSLTGNDAFLHHQDMCLAIESGLECANVDNVLQYSRGIISGIFMAIQNNGRDYVIEIDIPSLERYFLSSAYDKVPEEIKGGRLVAEFGVDGIKCSLLKEDLTILLYPQKQRDNNQSLLYINDVILDLANPRIFKKHYLEHFLDKS